LVALLGTFLILILSTGCKKAEEEELSPEETLSSSLHGTTYGMKYWYEVASPTGVYQFTQVPYEDLSCKNCHIDTEEDGCSQCHERPGDEPTSDKCYNCHGRQNKEKMLYTDYHRDNLGMDCADCHTGREIHGDGTHYNSFLEEGAMDTKCTNCHHTDELPSNSEHQMHLSDIDCSACHTQSVISCYNCHFESEIDYDVKLPYGGFKDWTFLVNYRGKVYAGNIMSITYEGNTFIAIGPYTSHTVTEEGRHCSDCHESDALEQYRENGEIQAVWWDESSGTLQHLTGVIPVPPDYQNTLKFAFVQCVSGCDNPQTAQWEFLKDQVDAWQILYATPLTSSQIEDLLNNP
jgi:hypothetical protein